MSISLGAKIAYQQRHPGTSARLLFSTKPRKGERAA